MRAALVDDLWWGGIVISARHDAKTARNFFSVFQETRRVAEKCG
jgi:hypothetical protein